MDELDLLLQLVLDPEQNNVGAFFKLAGMNDPRITTKLIQALFNQDSRVRTKAIWSLRETRDKLAIRPLVACLQDSDAEVRWSAAHVLAVFNDEQTIQPLIRTLTDPELNVRGAAAMALGQLKSPHAVEALLGVLPDVPEIALEALIAIGDKRAVEPLIALLRDEIAKKSNYLRIRVRRKIIEALGDFGDARAVDVLIESLNDWDNEGLRTYEFEPIGGDFPSVCHYAAKALEKIGTAEALDKVRQWRSTPYPDGGLRWT